MAPTQPELQQQGQIIIRKPEVRARTGLSDSGIWRLEKRGDFPARVLLSPGGIAVGWYLQEVKNWCASRPRASGPRPPLPKRLRQAALKQGATQRRRAPTAT
jgi:prophage regulatory protein